MVFLNLPNYDTIRNIELDNYLASRFDGANTSTAEELVTAKLETITEEELHEDFTEAQFSCPDLYRSLVAKFQAGDSAEVGRLFCEMINKHLTAYASNALSQGYRADEVWK